MTSENRRTVQFFPKNVSQSKQSDQSVIRNFSRMLNNLPIEIRKKKRKQI